MKFLVLSLLSFQAFSWGHIGHRVVGEVAWRHLSPKAKVKVSKIMNGKSLADAGTWADEMKSNPKYNFLSPSHYTSVDDHKAYKKERDNDIAGMIEKIVFSLSGLKKMKGFSEKEQISLLTHFIGDIHQPLHVGRRHDRGGNDIRVIWFGEEKNLHSVWDSGIIDALKLSYSELVKFIDYKQNIKKEWTGDKLEEDLVGIMMKESIALRPIAYNLTQSYSEDTKTLHSLESIFKKHPHADKSSHKNNFKKSKVPHLGWSYLFRTAPVVKKRLLMAGVRLGYILNELYGH